MAQKQRRKKYRDRWWPGFTLLEVLVTVVIVGILASLAASLFVNLNYRIALNGVQAAALQYIQQAQNNAEKQQVVWEVAFKDTGSQTEWAMTSCPAFSSTNPCATLTAWNPLGSNPSLFAIKTGAPYTTLVSNANGYYTLTFDSDGTVDSSNTIPAQITFVLRSSTVNPKRCVIVETILGETTTAGEDSTADTGCG